jgi:glycosyltransferase involved in cell wall biosynthesis
MNKPRVLVASPSYYGKDYCTVKYLNAVRSFTYENFDFIMVDNSPKGEEWYATKLKRMGVRVFKTSRGRNSREAINNSMNFIRNYALEHKYDYLLVVESDLFPEPDTIQRLLRFGKKVVGSYYLLGHEQDTIKYDEIMKAFNNKIISQEEATFLLKGLEPERACIFLLDRKQDGRLGSKNLTPKESIEWFGNGLKQVHGCGLGCTLISKSILEKFAFWTDNRFDNKHHDVYFYLDLHNAGIPVFVDTDRNIPHMPSRWSNVPDM